MADEIERRTLSYLPQPNIDVVGEVEFPIQINFIFKNVERVSPSKKIILLSTTHAIEEQPISLTEEDMMTIKSLYDALHLKVPALPENNHIFIFIDVKEPPGYKGFISDDSHVHLMAAQKADSIVAIMNDTFYARAIMLRKKKFLPDSLMVVLESPPPVVSQAARTINSLRARRTITRTRIQNDALDESIVDNPRPFSSIAIDAFDADIAFIPVSPKFRHLFVALNAALVAMDLHLTPRGRTTTIDEEEIKDIVCSIFESHIPSEEEDYSDVEIHEHEEEYDE